MGLELALRELVTSGETELDLRDFFCRDRPSRVLIEGGFQDSWKKAYLDVGEFTIPEGTLRIHPGVDYDLDLVAKLNAQGSMEMVNVQPTPALEIPYNFFTGIQRPRGLLTEDGQLFYDCSLLDDQPDLAINFIRYLGEQYKAGKSFHQLYAEVKEQREK